MATRLVLPVLSLALALSACRLGGPIPSSDVSPEEARQQTEAWRAKHEADYRREWTTIAGLHFLRQGAQSAGRDPESDLVLPAGAPAHLGRFVLSGETVRFEPGSAATVTLRGTPVTGAVVLADDGGTSADVLQIGEISIAVHRSGVRKALRVWDPAGPLATGFLGFRWFAIAPSYRVVGRFLADASPRDVEALNTFGDTDTFRTEGVVEFALQGHTLRLRPFTTRPGRLYFVFKDASSGRETYGAARFLYSDLRKDGTTVLDFNQAYNPPCAFNPFTTCPLPLPENRLPVSVLAGERAYLGHPDAAGPPAPPRPLEGS